MKFGIRKKLLLLIVSLSLALIVSSVFIASRQYRLSLENNSMKICKESCESLVDSIEKTQIDFVNTFKDKILTVYAENLDELEYARDHGFESLDKRETFYDSLMVGIFPPKQGLGLSYETLQFQAGYQQLLDDMDILAFAGGLDSASVFCYDETRNNIIYLIDRMPENSAFYNYPASIRTPWSGELANALKTRSAVTYLSGKACCAVMPISGTENRVFVLFTRQNTEIDENLRLFSLYTFGTLLGATVIIGLVVLWFANRLIVRNVKKLSKASERFTSAIGTDSIQKTSAGIRSRDEIGALSAQFDLMQDSILSYLSSLAEKTSKEEKMKAELALAARIQAEALPAGGLRAGSAEVDSFLKPARDVGGDLYDYFMLDETRLFFCLADVSGKGIPASLFMMRARELIKAGVSRAMSLDSFAYRLNNELCRGNEESIFITAFFGILDTETGKLTYLRAGHEQPMLRHGSDVVQLGEESNCVLGVFEDMAFTADEITLRTGDLLLMFTDGLNEGVNDRNEQFGYERIRQVLLNADGDVLHRLYEALCAFSAGAEQFDDVTMLLLTYGGSLSFHFDRPDYGSIDAVTDAVLAELRGFNPDRVNELGIILDEVMNNQISYAFEGVAAPQLEVRLKVCGNAAELIFEDNGKPFDPLSADTEEQPEDAEGGQGIRLIKGLSESQTYSRTGDRNRLVIRKTLLLGN